VKVEVLTCRLRLTKADISAEKHLRYMSHQLTDVFVLPNVITLVWF